MTSRPNVVVILSDQLRAQAVGTYGNRVVQTPNIDCLARNGVCFEHGITNNPVCVPARSILLTGQYGRTCTGSLHNEASIWPLNSERRRLLDPTLPEVLRSHGYETAVIGKWHVDPAPELVGFESSVIPVSVGSHPWFSENNGPLFDVSVFAQDYELYRFSEFVNREHHRPFFLYYNIYSPHMPLLDVPLRYQRMYSADDVVLRSNVRPEQSLPEETMWLHTYLWEHHYARQPYEPVLDQLPEGFGLRDLIALYYGSVSWVDAIVGQTISMLESAGLAQDTVVLFASDHGDLLGSHAGWNKDRFWEEAIRVPVIFYAPGMLNPYRNEAQLAQLVDIMPTILDLCDISVPDHVQGTSLVPALRGRQQLDGENLAFVETGMYELAVRTPSHKYARRLPIPGGKLPPWLRIVDDETPEFLFDLRVDPCELTNLIGMPSVQDVQTYLSAALSMWDRDTSWRIPADARHP